MSNAADRPQLMDPSELADRLHEPSLRIVDLSPPEIFAQNHVPGAVNVPYERLVYGAPPVGGLLPDLETLAGVLADVGIDGPVHVVALDAEGGGAAGRLLWTLETLGHSRISLVDGGLAAWVHEGYPVETGSSRPIAANPMSLQPPSGPIADADEIRGRLSDPEFVTLDARSHGEFTGATVRAARGGHIPGARHYEWTRAMDRERNLRLRPFDTIRAELESLGITPEREVVVYCHTHHRSAFSYALLRILGYPAVKGYPGSWSDWGNRTDTPIETGDCRS